MPDYKTHSIHSEILLKNKINNRVLINKDSLKLNSFGPDSLMFSDYKLFEYQHGHKTQEYFETLLSYIKEYKLQGNEKVLSFLYGQLDHFVLDITLHPLINYMNSSIPQKKYLLDNHALIEMWMTNYLIKKYNVNNTNYYKEKNIVDIELSNLINRIYEIVYNSRNTTSKYKFGTYVTLKYDKLIRSSTNKTLDLFLKKTRIGDILYNSKTYKIKPYLNLSHRRLINLETKEEFKDSFDDLWEKSIISSLELIEDINKYLYLDKSIKNPIIKNNISYDTGTPCLERVLK